MKLVIIDDDLQFAMAMKNDLLIHFCKYDEDVEIDIIDDNYFNLINANQYLFYFIDIDLNNINGYDLANRIKQNQKNCFIIFVSSHNDLIHDSYNLRAYYFIRKSSYKKDLNIFYSILDQEFQNNDTFIDLNYKMSKTQISLNQIIYLESQDHKIKIVTVNETYFDNRTLKAWVQLLPDDKFIQIHRSFIININHLISYRKGHLIMINNEDLVIGRVYKNKFDQFYQEYLLK